MDSVKGCLANTWRKIRRRKTIDRDAYETKLHRCLSTSDLILLGVGHMVGSGIYVVTGTVMLNISGPSIVVSYLLAGFVALLIGLCYAQFSVNVPRTGTCYSYVYLVAGELMGFLAGWNLLLEYIISVSAVGRSFSDYLNEITGGAIVNATWTLMGPGHSSIVYQLDFVSPAAILLIYIIIAVGVRSTVNVNNVMCSINILVIGIIVIAGLVAGNVDNLTKGPGGFLPYGFSGTIAGMGVVFFSYLGFDAIAIASEETENPSKSLPIAFGAAISIAIFLYVMAAFALAVLVPYNEVVASAPFPYAFGAHGMQWTRYAVSIGAIIGLICSLLGQSYSLPRGLYAIASDGLLFSQLTYINSWTKTPLISVAISAVLSALLAMILKVDELVEMVSIGSLFAMSMMIMCLIKIHYIPAVDCPFEITAHRPAATEELSAKENESKPILRKANRQLLERIGTLRWDFRPLIGLNTDRVIDYTITVLTTSFIALSCLLVVGLKEIVNGYWWAILLLVISLVTSFGSLCVLLSYEHNTSFTKFKVRTTTCLINITCSGFVPFCRADLDAVGSYIK